MYIHIHTYEMSVALLTLPLIKQLPYLFAMIYCIVSKLKIGRSYTRDIEITIVANDAFVFNAELWIKIINYFTSIIKKPSLFRAYE